MTALAANRAVVGQGDRAASLGSRAAALIRRKPMGAAAAAVLVVFGVMAVAAPWLAPHDPYAGDRAAVLHAPGSAYWLGTDNFGRDIASRIIYGARVSLGVGLFSVALGVGLGAVLGLVGGFFQGIIDIVTQRVLEMITAFPTIILALVVISILGPSLRDVVIVIAITIVPMSTRVVRASTLASKHLLFVESARSVGASEPRIIIRHIFPAVVPSIIVVATVTLGQAIVVEAALSFLGLGVPPPDPSWGQMMGREARRYFDTAPWIAIFPGLTLGLAVLSFNLLGDALRDVLDPRLRGGS